MTLLSESIRFGNIKIIFCFFFSTISGFLFTRNILKPQTWVKNQRKIATKLLHRCHLAYMLSGDYQRSRWENSLFQQVTQQICSNNFNMKKGMVVYEISEFNMERSSLIKYSVNITDAVSTICFQNATIDAKQCFLS